MTLASAVSLELKAVGLSRGGRPLIADLSFALGPGQLGLVTGPNGSGKTTLLRTIAGLAPPERGEIRVAGRPLGSLDADERRLLAYQAHLEGLKKDLTVEENILFNSQMRENTDPIYEVMTELGLGPLAGRSVRQLSAGQKRRVVLAILRLSGAVIWLLDEPLTNLDPAGRDLVVAWLGRHLDGGGIAVVATHLADALRRPGSVLVEF